MESDLQHQPPPMFLDQHHHQHQHQQQPMNSGLTRFKSAPSSYFSSIIDKEFYDSIFNNNRPSSPDTDRIFTRFVNSLAADDGGSGGGAEEDNSPVLQIAEVKEEVIVNNNLQSAQPNLPSLNNNEQVVLQQQQQQGHIGNYGSGSGANQNFYQSFGRPPLPNQMKSGRGSASNLLIRHGSSPAGLFSNINIETGYASNFLKSNNAPTYPSSGLMLSPKAEIMNTTNRLNNNLDNEVFAESQGNNDFTIPSSSWDDSSSIMPDNNITGRKRYREEDVKPFSALNAAETQNETGAPGPLGHQLSMPNTSAEIEAIEKFLNSDSVVCKLRAKRGCATHPRSIAERVRRTKISERMRKLQDLVPNMDKQTNTADMLDLAVEYIKDLQNQVETLSDSRAKCTCSHKQHQ